jgi:DNA polymerase
VAAVPRRFLAMADTAIAIDDPRRHAVLYRLLWRITHGEHNLLDIASDNDMAWLSMAIKAVNRDMHKMKAFVRFREVTAGDEPVFVAWFEPSHDIVARVAPFFQRRFAGMRWSILTPSRSAHWDKHTLTIGTGASKADAPTDDALEDLWRTYFASIFNPARLKVNAMRREMPVRYWKNMPEAGLIPGLIRDASPRMEAMVKAAHTEPLKRIPAPVARRVATVPEGSLAALRRDAAGCCACPLWEPATQTVFGEGPAHARIVVIGEQPGDQEDLANKPFVGPAGQLFDRALAEAAIPRAALYVTNTVKHFKFEPRGKRRLHARANAEEQAACRPWLAAELDRIKPAAVVCLGAMAAQAIFGASFRLLKERGRWRDVAEGMRAFATVHPSYLLRLPDEQARSEAYAQFVDDLRLLHAEL